MFWNSTSNWIISQSFSNCSHRLYPFTHDLVELLEALKDLGFNIPKDLYAYADALTPHYTMVRYPGRKPVKYNKGLAERCLEYAKRIIKWIEGQASKSSSWKQKRRDELLKEYIEVLKKIIPQSAIFLSGSRARESHVPYSDYDIVIVFKIQIRDKLKMIEYLKKFKLLGISLDLVVLTLDDLKDLIIKEMLKNSKILYNNLGVKF